MEDVQWKRDDVIPILNIPSYITAILHFTYLCQREYIVLYC